MLELYRTVHHWDISLLRVWPLKLGFHWGQQYVFSESISCTSWALGLTWVVRWELRVAA